MRRSVLVVVLATAGVWSVAAQQQGPTAAEQIERAIGSLYVQNATLQEQLRQANDVIAKLRQELEAAKGTAEPPKK